MKRFALLACMLAPASASAESRCASIEMTPSDKLQVVAWIETPSGAYQRTIYITQQTGRYGLGNRPGRWDFNSGPMWPYGRRIATFPVWAHKHAEGPFSTVIFQSCCSSETGTSDDPTFCESLVNDPSKPSPYDRQFADCSENDLSHAFAQSSREPHYCQPLMPSDPKWVQADAMTCATVAFTDKGKFSSTVTSLYPPRTDLSRTPMDSPSVELYQQSNPYDAVSQATPAGGAPQAIAWPIPDDLADGSYVLFVEAAKEFDQNATYSESMFPAPASSGDKAISWSSFGLPYRGQPSVVYKVPFTISAGVTTAQTDAYAGYSDPTGADGALRPPDTTITTDTPGSGAARLQLMSDGSAMFRVRVSVRPNDASTLPGMPIDIVPQAIEPTKLTLQFTAPGDGDKPVGGYDVRIKAGGDITPDTFDAAMKVATTVTPAPPGQIQTLELTGLLPETDYTIAIRAYDACRNLGEIAFTKVRTGDRIAGEVDACFIATAAYGSIMANDVELLRHFRDSALEHTVLGELAVETYYTFGPPVAGVVGQSDVLRTTARGMLEPLVQLVRRLKY